MKRVNLTMYWLSPYWQTFAVYDNCIRFSVQIIIRRKSTWSRRIFVFCKKVNIISVCKILISRYIRLVSLPILTKGQWVTMFRLSFFALFLVFILRSFASQNKSANNVSVKIFDLKVERHNLIRFYNYALKFDPECCMTQGELCVLYVAEMFNDSSIGMINSIKMTSFFSQMSANAAKQNQCGKIFARECCNCRDGEYANFKNPCVFVLFISHSWIRRVLWSFGSKNIFSFFILGRDGRDGQNGKEIESIWMLHWGIFRDIFNDNVP